jgi:hypothetical protein
MYFRTSNMNVNPGHGNDREASAEALGGAMSPVTELAELYPAACASSHNLIVGKEVARLMGRGKCSLSLPDLSNSDPKRYGIYLRGWLNRAMEALT